MATTDELEKAIALAKKAGDEPAVRDLNKMLMDAVFDPKRDMTRGQRVMANIGAGMDSVVQGVKQTFGGASSQDIRDKNALDSRLANSTTGGGLLQGVGTAAMLAPTALIPGAATIPGAAAIGAGTGALMPTEDESILAGKAKQAAIGAGTGAVMQKGFNVIADKFPNWAQATKEYLATRGMMPGGGAVRQDIADRAVAASISNPAAAHAALMNYKTSVPGMKQTTGAVLEDPAMLAVERRAFNRPDAVGEMLRDRAISNNSAAYQFAERQLSGDVQAARDTASNFAQTAKGAMTPRTKGQPVVFQDMGRAVSRLHELEQKAVAPQIKSELASLRSQIESAWDIARTDPKAGLQAFHEVRMTGIDDALDRLYQSNKKGSKLLRRQLEEVELYMDDALNRGLVGKDTWTKFLEGYKKRATKADQIEAGEELLSKIRTGGRRAGSVTGEPDMLGSVDLLRRTNERGLVDRYGKPTFTPKGEDAIAALEKELRMAARPESLGVSPRGSDTASNLLSSETMPINQLIARAEQARGAAGRVSAGEAGTTIAGLVTGNPVLAAAGVGKAFVLDPMKARALDDVVVRMMRTYMDPDLAFQALAKAQAPKQVKEYVALRLAQRFAGASAGISAPALASSGMQ